MKAQLRCTAYPGQFSCEYALSVESFAGESFSLFADRCLVECDREPTLNQDSPGWLDVRIVDRGEAHYLAADRKEAHYLVLLPQSTLEAGTHLWVRDNQIRRIPVEV